MGPIRFPSFGELVAAAVILIGLPALLLGIIAGWLFL